MLLSLPARAAAAVLFGGLSAARRKRIFHPIGSAYEATFTPVAGALGTALFTDGEPHRAVVRMSKGIGLPGRLPDVLGLAVKVLDPEQDFLLVTARFRHLLWPAAHAAARPYSSLLFFRAGDEAVVLGAEAEDDEARHFRLTADGRTIAYVTLGEALSDDVSEALRFNPANAGGGIVPADPLNRLRDAAYRGSQAARPRSGPQVPLQEAGSGDQNDR